MTYVACSIFLLDSTEREASKSDPLNQERARGHVEDDAGKAYTIGILRVV